MGGGTIFVLCALAAVVLTAGSLGILAHDDLWNCARGDPHRRGRWGCVARDRVVCRLLPRAAAV